MAKSIHFNRDLARKKLEYIRDCELMSLREFARYMNLSFNTLQRILDPDDKRDISYAIKRKIRDLISTYEEKLSPDDLKDFLNEMEE